MKIDIPQSLVAQQPMPRGNTRLLVRKTSGELVHTQFRELVNFLENGSLLILNNSKVFPARLMANSGGKKFELFLLSHPAQITAGLYQSEALAKPSKEIYIGQELALDENVWLKVLAKKTTAEHTIFKVQINCSENLLSWLEKKAFVPLPPYIKRSTPVPAKYSPDYSDYQTIYAHKRGSVAAPTAGLHFSSSCLQKLKQNGIEIAYLTLHVSGGTFLPIRTKNVAEHTLLKEKYLVPTETLKAISSAKQEKRCIIGVGTTTLRALESFFNNEDSKTGSWQETALYIYPQKARYRPQVLDALITNFHQPSSTLFLLICGLIGSENAINMYQEAVQKEYRFFSYGDGCLLFL